MEVSIETTEGLKRKMTVTISKDSIDTAVEKKLHEIKGSVKVDGFRPGKVPFSVVKKQYAGAVRADIINELIQSSYGEALAQENINPAGMPSIDTEEGAFLDGDFTYTANFEVYPEITVTDLSKLKIENPNSEVTDKDIDEMLEKLRGQNKTWSEVDRAAKDEDQITISFVGTMDGEPFEGGTAKDVPITLGTKSMIEGFEEGLVGLKAGDETTLNLSFPKEYQAKHLAGKDVAFAVTATKVEEPKLPEVDDEFVAKFGVKKGGVDALKVQLRTNMERECAAAKKQMIKAQVMDTLVDAHSDLEVPVAMIDQEVDHMIKTLKQQMQGQDLGDLFKNTDAMQPEATRRVRLGLLISQIIEDNKITLDEAMLKDFVESEASSYDEPEAFIDYYMNNPENLNSIKPVVLEAQVVDYINQTAKVSPLDISFSDLMAKAAPNQ